MRNRNILLTGTMLLRAAATAAGAPQGGGQGSEGPVLTALEVAPGTKPVQDVVTFS